jgi:hypothetical protein
MQNKIKKLFYESVYQERNKKSERNKFNNKFLFSIINIFFFL